MKKMLVKAVALSLVLGGVGFVANNAQAAPWDDIQWQSKIDGNHARSMQNQKDIAGLKGDVATNKDNITKNAKGISDNKVAIKSEEGARQWADFQTNLKVDGEIKDRKDADQKLEQKSTKMQLTF